MMKSIVVDLDGTLCDSSHRSHLALAGKWDDFHSQLSLDEPHHDVKLLIDKMCNDVVVIGLTGRSELFRAATFRWLDKHGICIDHLLMRPEGNFLSDTVIKPHLLTVDYFDSVQQAKDSVSFILEDREKMVECWRNLGFNCWQVRHGGY